jgi:hypothetical protein
MAKKTGQIEIIDVDALRTLKAALEKQLAALGKEHGVAFNLTKGRYSNGNTGEFKLEIVIAAGKSGGKSAADILGAENWKTYAKSFGLNPKLLGKTFEYKGVECKIKGIAPSRRKFPVQVNMAGKAKLFPVETVMMYADPKNADLAARAARFAGARRKMRV